LCVRTLRERDMSATSDPMQKALPGQRGPLRAFEGTIERACS
jgi:hypothetical protein